MIYLGIDPGFDGAVCAMDESDASPLLYDTPTLKIGGGKGHRRAYNLAEMRLILSTFKVSSKVAIERVHAMPGQGVRSMFSMGYGLGVWEGLLVGLGLSYEYVSPQAWKKALMDGQGKEKDASRIVAMRLFPSVADQLARKKDHGRADALLIAEWLRRTAA